MSEFVFTHTHTNTHIIYWPQVWFGLAVSIILFDLMQQFARIALAATRTNMDPAGCASWHPPKTYLAD